MMSNYTDSVINKWLNVSLAHVSSVKRRSSNKTGTKHFQLCLFGVKITIIMIAMCFQEKSSFYMQYGKVMLDTRRCTFNFSLGILKGQNMMEGGNGTLIQPGAMYVKPVLILLNASLSSTAHLFFFIRLRYLIVSTTYAQTHML